MGRLPTNLVAEISRLHAAAVLDGRDFDRPQTVAGGQKSPGACDVEPLTGIS